MLLTEKQSVIPLVLLPSLFLLFVQSGIQTHGIVLFTFNVGFPSITNPLWKHLHRNSEMCLLGDFRCSNVTSNDNHTPCPAQSVYFLSCSVSTFKMYL